MPEAGEPAPGSGSILGVIFDLDGVIVDTEHLWEEAWATCARRHGSTWDGDDTTL